MSTATLSLLNTYILVRPLPRSFQRATGFAEQQDIHEPTATVRESLQFSALLRQPKEVPVKEKYDYCEKIIDLLEMRSIAGATVGSGGVGLNQEQKKRLTIAVELASKPSLLLFLDEPTSGLDSLAAFNSKYDLGMIEHWLMFDSCPFPASIGRCWAGYPVHNPPAIRRALRDVRRPYPPAERWPDSLQRRTRL